MRVRVDVGIGLYGEIRCEVTLFDFNLYFLDNIIQNVVDVGGRTESSAPTKMW